MEIKNGSWESIRIKHVIIEGLDPIYSDCSYPGDYKDSKSGTKGCSCGSKDNNSKYYGNRIGLQP